MNKTYKYDPNTFSDVLNLSHDLSNFYTALEKYHADKSLENRFFLKNQWSDLFFTIKHREVEGFLNPVEAHDIRFYLEELVNG